MQVKLLSRLQEGKVRGIGSTEEADVDVRISLRRRTRHLKRRLRKARFREAVYYRVSVTHRTCRL